MINTNATDTFLLSHPVSPEQIALLKKTFHRRPFVVQPFIENITTEGEFSLFHFGDQYSHAIQKVPRRGDFRVQEEHGSQITAIEPESALLQTADHVISLVDPLPVYCRSDFVRGDDGRFLLMELELIEPSMYLRFHKDAPRRFARAFDAYVRKLHVTVSPTPSNNADEPAVFVRALEEPALTRRLLPMHRLLAGTAPVCRSHLEEMRSNGRPVRAGGEVPRIACHKCRRRRVSGESSRDRRRAGTRAASLQGCIHGVSREDFPGALRSTALPA